MPEVSADNILDEIANLINDLGSSQLPSAEVEAIWESDFTDYDTYAETVPACLDESDKIVQITKQLTSQVRRFNAYAVKTELDNNCAWQYFRTNDVSYRSLVVFAYYGIERAMLASGDNRLTTGKMKIGLCATQLYWSLLSLPGANAYKIHNNTLIKKCMDVYRQAGTCILGSEGMDSMQAKLCEGPRRKNAKKPVKKRKDGDADETSLGPLHHDEGMDVRECLDASLLNVWLAVSSNDVAFHQTVIDNAVLSLSSLFMIDGDAVRFERCRDVDSWQDIATLGTSERVLCLFHAFAKYNRHGQRSHVSHLHVSDMMEQAYGDLLNRQPELKSFLRFNLDDLCSCCLSSFVMPNLLLAPKSLSMEASSAISASTTIPSALNKLREIAANFVAAYIDRLLRLPLNDSERKPRLQTVVRMTQHMLARCNDKTDYRSKVIASVCSIVNQLRAVEGVFADDDEDDEEKLKETVLYYYCQFMYDMTSCSRPNWRGIGIECTTAVYKLLEDNQEHALCTLVGIILLHCTDRAPSCRQKALLAVSHMMAHDADRTFRVCNTVRQRMIDTINSQSAADGTDPKDHPDAKKEFHLGRLVMRGLSDDGAVVRKSAIQAAESILVHQLPQTGDALPLEWPNHLLLLLCQRGMDPTLSVRKQAAESITNILFARPDHKALRSQWLKVVLPLITDRENSLVDSAVRLSRAVIFENLLTINDNTPLAWHLLDEIEAMEDLRRYLTRVLVRLGNPSKDKPGDASVIPKLVRAMDRVLTETAEHRQTAWMLMADLSIFNQVPYACALQSWRELADRAISSSEPTRLLKCIGQVIANTAGKMPVAQAEMLCDDIKDRIALLRLTPECVSIMVYCVYKLTHRANDNNQTTVMSVMRDFAHSVIGKCEKYLSVALFSTSASVTTTNHQNHDADDDDNTSEGSSQPLSSQTTNTHTTMIDYEEPTDEGIIRRLCTLAELCQYAPKLITTRQFKMVETFLCLEQIQKDLTTTIISQPGASQTQSASQNYNHQTVATDNTTTANNNTTTANDAEQRSASQNSVTSNNDGSLIPAHRQMTYSNMLRAQAVVALGKMCLHDEMSANECVQLLVREMTTNRQDTMRNNCLIVLSDLAVRYTALVEPHLSAITSCLKDPSKLVRQQTLTVLTSLIKEDYLRFKGLLLHRFMSALLDVDQTIREFTQFCLIHVLKVRHPAMFYTHFVECVFHFNGCRHPSWTSEQNAVVVETDREANMFSLKGDDKEKARWRLYNFMLNNFDDKEKFETMAKLVSEVLGLVGEETLKVDEKTTPMIADTLKILSSDAIKLSFIKKAKKGADNMEDEIEDEVERVTSEHYNKVVTAILRKTAMEQIIPNIIACKNIFVAIRSPLVHRVRQYLSELCIDFKADIDELLAADKRLGAEVKYDLRIHREDTERAAAKQARHEERLKRHEERKQARQQQLARANQNASGSAPPAAEPDAVREPAGEGAESADGVEERRRVAPRTENLESEEADENTTPPGSPSSQSQSAATPTRTADDGSPSKLHKTPVRERNGQVADDDAEQVARESEQLARQKGTPMPAISEDGAEFRMPPKRKVTDMVCTEGDDTITDMPLRLVSTPQQRASHIPNPADLTFGDPNMTRIAETTPVNENATKRKRTSTRRQ